MYGSGYTRGLNRDHSRLMVFPQSTETRIIFPYNRLTKKFHPGSYDPAVSNNKVSIEDFSYVEQKVRDCPTFYKHAGAVWFCGPLGLCCVTIAVLPIVLLNLLVFYWKHILEDDIYILGAWGVFTLGTVAFGFFIFCGCCVGSCIQSNFEKKKVKEIRALLDNLNQTRFSEIGVSWGVDETGDRYIILNLDYKVTTDRMQGHIPTIPIDYGNR